tara:strand:+ start:308 stop:409 length:102 start_codon:yes stop_codon:yes gene_type:complete
VELLLKDNMVDKVVLDVVVLVVQVELVQLQVHL